MDGIRQTRGVALLTVAALAAGCTSEVRSGSGGAGASIWQPPRLTMTLDPSVISVGGFRQEATLTVRSDRSGSLAISAGDRCGDGEVIDTRSIGAGGTVTVTLQPTGALAAAAEHKIQACLDGGTARNAVLLTVDDSPPTAAASLLSGTYCGSRWVELRCADCAGIVYGTSADVAFGSDLQPTAGELYRGPILASGATTIFFRGIDAAGNQQDVQQVDYTIRGQPPLAIESVSSAVISANPASSKQQADITWSSEAGLPYSVRVNSTACTDGTVVESGTTAASNTSSVGATWLWTFTDNVVRICVGAGNCAAEVSTTLRRKDSSLGWQPDPVAYAAGLDPHAAWADFYFLDAEVDATAAVLDAALELGPYIYGALTQVAVTPSITVYGTHVHVGFALPRFPDYAAVAVTLSATGLRDEAGNPLPVLPETRFTTAGVDEWYSFAAGSFTAGADTVTDSATGLVWQLCSVGQGVGCAGEPTALSWAEAVAACSALNDAGLGGRTDWRLPSLGELISLVQPSMAPGWLIDASFGVGTVEHRYWTASVSSTSQAWALGFALGRAERTYSTDWRAGRCVAGTGSSVPRTFSRVSWDGAGFSADAAGDVVYDEASGLYWERVPSNITTIFSVAESGCQGTVAGTTGWRLMSSADLATLASINGTPAFVSTPFTVYSPYWLGEPLGGTDVVAPSTATYSTSVGFAYRWCVHP